MDEGKKNILMQGGFQKYLAMNLFSRSSTSVSSLIIIWYVFSVTGSPIYVAIVGITEGVAAIIMSLPAGMWADKGNKMMLLAISNGVRAVAVFIMILISEIYGFNIVAVVVLVFSWDAASEIYRSSSYSVLPDMVDSNNLADANGILRTGTNIMRSVSNVIGGELIFLVGISLALTYSLTGYLFAFVFSMLLISSGKLKKSDNIIKNNTGRSGKRDIIEGFKWLYSQKGLFWLSISAFIFNFFFSTSLYFLVIYDISALGQGSLIYGLILAAYLVGHSAGSMLVGRVEGIMKHTGKVWIMLYGGINGLTILLMGLFPEVIFAISLSIVMGLSVGFAGNVWLTGAQNVVPSGMRGRYFATDGLLSVLSGPPAVAAGGFMVLVLNIENTYIISGLIMVIFAVILIFANDLWNFDASPLPSA